MDSDRVTARNGSSEGMTKMELGRPRGAINSVIYLPKPVPKPTLFPNYTTASTAARIGGNYWIGSGPVEGV